MILFHDGSKINGQIFCTCSNDYFMILHNLNNNYMLLVLNKLKRNTRLLYEKKCPQFFILRYNDYRI